jgi:hypothetical protein
MCWSAPASAQAVSSGTDTGSAAVVTPLLEIFDFGVVVGMPLVCNDLISVGSIAAQELQVSAAASPFLTQIVTQCAAFAAQGDSFLEQGISASQALTALNPVLNPLIAAFSNTLDTTASGYGTSLAPLGPTIAGLGGSVAYFEGS